MNCEMFKKGINDFKHHPILSNRLVEKHKKENPDCNCNLEYIRMEKI